MGATGIQTVIEVDGFETVETNDVVKICQHSLQVVDYIIATVLDVAGIQAYAQLILEFHLFDDVMQFLEGAAYFRAFSCHGF